MGMEGHIVALKLPNFTREYYVEDLKNDLESLMKAELNNFIGQMNLEKTDLTLKEVDTTLGYFYQTMNEIQVNTDPFIFWGELPPESTSVNTGTSKNYLFNIGLIMAIGNEESYQNGTKLLRYRKILEELFEAGWQSVNKRIKLEVNSLAPFPFELTNSSEPYAGIGVSIAATLS